MRRHTDSIELPDGTLYTESVSVAWLYTDATLRALGRGLWWLARFVVLRVVPTLWTALCVAGEVAVGLGRAALVMLSLGYYAAERSEPW